MDPINQPVQVGGGSNKTLYIVIGILILLLIGGYLYMRSNSAENKMYDAYDVDVDNNLDGSKTIKSDYGTVTTSKELPKNWPSDAPTYKNATISQSASSEIAGANGSQVTFTTSDSVQTILDFYKAELTTSGWASLYPGKAITGTQMGAITTLSAKKDSRSFTAMITTNTETNKQVVTIVLSTTPDMKDYKTGL